MATNNNKVLITEQTLTDVADAIRSKNGASDTYLPGEMAPAIRNLTGNMSVAIQGSTLILRGDGASLSGTGELSAIDVNGKVCSLVEAPPNTQPIIKNGNWWVWDVDSNDYVDSGVSATGPQGPKGDKGDTGDVTDTVIEYANLAYQSANAAEDAAAAARSAIVKVLVVNDYISSLPTTIENQDITADMVVINSELGDPFCQIGDWTVETAAGSATISGTFTGDGTTLTLYLAHVR